MQRFWWPDYQMHLLGELQRQQNNAQFCDTLLKTEGISVPTHSCVLAALSPYLSQKLSASPSPPSGQKREVQLRALKAQTLLKLVGLLYSGEMEVKGGVEQRDVLSAVRQFGILDLVEGPRNGGYSGSCQEKTEAGKKRSESRKMQDAQVQAGMAGRRDEGSVVRKRSNGTGTVEDFEKTVDSPFTQAGQAKHPIPQPAFSVAQSLAVSTSVNSQNITFNHFSTALCPHVTSVTESELDRSSDSVRNSSSTSVMSSKMMPSLFHLNGDPNSTTPQEDNSYVLPETGDSIQALAEKAMGSKDGKANGKTAEIEQPSDRDRDLGEENENSAEKRHACENEGNENVRIKSLAMTKHMQKMIQTETTQVSIKVKLRRRNKGEVWEIVSLKDRDETLSVLTSLTQDGSIHKRTQVDLTEGASPLSSVQPETLNLQPATTNSLEPPIHPNTSNSQLFSGVTPNNGLKPVPQPQPPGPAEDCDEQIEKLLEDIMMGLNILPNLERDCKTPQYLQGNHDQAPAVCQVPVTEDEPQSQMNAAVSVAGCTYYQDFETYSSVEAAQNQPSCSSPSSVRPAAVPIQTCPSPEAPRTISVIPTTLCSSGQKQRTNLKYYPECQSRSSQDSCTNVELTLTSGNMSQSWHSLPCVKDLQLLQCTSPLQPSSSKHLRPLNNPTSWCDKIHPQHRRPWLTGKPASLKFPLSAMVHRVNCSCCSKQQQKPLELSSQSGATWAAFCAAKEVEEKGAVIAGCQSDAAELKSDSRKMTNKQGDTEDDTAAPKKRKCAGHPQEASSLLPCKRVKVSGGTKHVVNLSACSVSLSSNNLLAKEREIATNSSNTAHKYVKKLNEPLTVTEGIPIRGELNAEKCHDTLILKPKAPRASTVNTGGIPKHRRGRPRKTTVKESSSESSAAVIEKKIDNGKDVPVDSNLQKTESLRTKRRRRKEFGNINEEQVVPLMKTINAEAANNSDVIPTEGKLGTLKRPRMVTLKEFQKLIQCQQSKLKKSKVRHDRQTASAVEGEDDKTFGSRCEELTKKIDMDVAQPQNRGGIKESSVILNVDDVDENHNQIFNKPTAEFGKTLLDETNNSTSKDSNLFGDESHLGFFCDILGEDRTKIPVERELPLKKPDGAQKVGDAGMSITTPQTISDETSSASGVHPPQDNTITLDNNLNPQSPDRTSPPLSIAVRFDRSSSCDHEEEEEVEVDVMLFSPDKVLQRGECENGLNMEITPEEEEEEDIDVTGDEAE